MTVLPSSSFPPQKWHLATPAGPDVLPVSLGCGAQFLAYYALLPSPSSCLHTANSSLLPGIKLQILSLSTQPMPEHLRLWYLGSVILMVHAALTLLCLPQSSCCNFLQDFEVPPSQLISLSVRWLPRVWVPFLFHSFLSGMLAPSSFLFSLFFFCSIQLCGGFLAFLGGSSASIQ